MTLESGAVPLWFQIANLLRASIASGEFKPGDALPSEAELFRVFGVSRTTARSSLDKLEQEGLILRQSGRGSIVQEPRVEQPLNLLAGFSEDMRRRGLVPSYQTLSASMVSPSADVRGALSVPSGRNAYRIHRLLKANGKVIATSTSWVAPDILGERTPPDREDLDSGSLYGWLERECGVRIAGGHEIIEAQLANGETAALLEISPASATLVASRTSTDISGKPVEYAIITYRADRYRFRVDLTS
ncbi:MAG: GntR family transcriptional regulator [Fulvimarina manganoxydans]|uniref:GntR family transcriptional regulator n=1 Tax=Fulvimarina manganoxydans TaxID=937218 RepID=UPI002354039F|nr:GntR family transcriptional regulator [Fulvimarina manganoxydans]MCK5932957.1 GntR family transcriptional regulator [Fulvimarina manganoxydans]